MYNYFSCACSICTFCTQYLVPATLYIFVHTQARLQLHSTASIGDPKVPFYAALAGHFMSRHRAKNKSAWTFLLGPMVHYVNCKYLPTTILWLVIPNLNLVVSCPHVSYNLYLHTFMLFRSTCLRLFSVDNSLRVATEALNIHLVSCKFFFFFFFFFLAFDQLGQTPPPPSPQVGSRNSEKF